MANIRVYRKCEECGKSFWGKATRFCSRDCWKKWLPRNHHLRIKRESYICKKCGKSFDERPSRKRRYCSKECMYDYLKTQKRELNPNWKGGYISQGYKYFGRNKREHRYVMEQHIGRELLPEERVHHINGDKLDNRIENLKLFNSVSEHIKAIHYEKCPNCGYTLRQ